MMEVREERDREHVEIKAEGIKLEQVAAIKERNRKLYWTQKINETEKKRVKNRQ